MILGTQYKIPLETHTSDHCGAESLLDPVAQNKRVGSRLVISLCREDFLDGANH